MIAKEEPMSRRLLVFLSTLPFVLLATMAGLRAQPQEMGAASRRVIIFVWDGLRADDLTPNITPNYFALARSGVVFTDHHAVYPTFTMMNSASIATGTYPGMHGFYGNVVYAPSAKGKNAKGADIDFFAPARIFSAWSKPCATPTRASSRSFRPCCRPHKPKG
jgi:predicted AlkP superfamily pyrophosphatase or phosphodiesterase